MTIQDMHYDFKKKLNKVDSQQYKNLLIPEIDWALNEAQSLFIDMIAKPRIQSQLGFEKNQKSIDDIRTVVIENNCSSPSSSNSESDLFVLPTDYRYFIKGHAKIQTESCGEVEARLYIQKQNDEFQEESFYRSSFDWRQVNGEFVFGGLRAYHGGEFSINTLCINYIQNPKYMHNAANYKNGTYNLPSGTVLTGTQDSVLPDHVHKEIVDLAVLVVSGEIQTPSYQEKLLKLNLTNLK